jgi:hypothetical protein
MVIGSEDTFLAWVNGKQSDLGSDDQVVSSVPGYMSADRSGFGRVSVSQTIDGSVAVALKGLDVLVALEDKKAVSSVIGRLQDLGCNAYEAGSPGNVVCRVRSVSPPDVAILDRSMMDAATYTRNSDVLVIGIDIERKSPEYLFTAAEDRAYLEWNDSPHVIVGNSGDGLFNYITSGAFVRALAPLRESNRCVRVAREQIFGPDMSKYRIDG